MIAGAIFGGSAWVATFAYFIGMAAIILSGIILKKTKMFSGDPAPFVMELPAYHLPTVKNVLRSMWERGWSFIKKAGTIILLSTIVIWFMTYFGFTSDGFRMLAEEEMDQSLLAYVGGAIAWIFAPLGWGSWQAAVASITGLVAKENIVGTMGILYPAGWPRDSCKLQCDCRLFFPGVQSAVRPLLCSNRRDQARDEQYEVDMVCHRLSVLVRLCDCYDGLPVRFRLYRKSAYYRSDFRSSGSCIYALHALQTV